MSGRKPVRAEPVCIAPHLAEFYLAVAQYVRVGRTSGFVFLKKVREDLLAVLVGEIHSVQGQLELPGDISRVLEITGSIAIAIVFPVAHVQALYVVACVT